VPAANDVTIALDGMGGDNAPDAAVEGAVLAARQLGARILLVGRRDELSSRLANQGAPASIEIVDASEVIETDEAPGQCRAAEARLVDRRRSPPG